MAAAGFFAQGQVDEVRDRYREWARSELLTQRLELRAVTGRVAGPIPGEPART
jgi:hypothetical protein